MRKLVALSVLAVCIFAVTGKGIAAVSNSPTLVSPVNGANVGGTTISLSWNQAARADDYYLQVATDINFTNIIFGDWVGNYISINLNNLPDNGQTFYWRVANV